MINQLNLHFTQWKNLTDEQQAEFDFEGYKYEYQNPLNNEWSILEHNPIGDLVYRLVIEKDKWYYTQNPISKHVFWGSDLIRFDSDPQNLTNISECNILRPATAEEIPKPEKTLKEKIEEQWPDYDVVMLEYEDVFLTLKTNNIVNNNCHIYAQSMKGFNGYVYLEDNGDIDKDLENNPTQIVWPHDDDYRIIQPVAVLLARGDG